MREIYITCSLTLDYTLSIVLSELHLHLRFTISVDIEFLGGSKLKVRFESNLRVSFQLGSCFCSSRCYCGTLGRRDAAKTVTNERRWLWRQASRRRQDAEDPETMMDSLGAIDDALLKEAQNPGAKKGRDTLVVGNSEMF